MSTTARTPDYKIIFSWIQAPSYIYTSSQVTQSVAISDQDYLTIFIQSHVVLVSGTRSCGTENRRRGHARPERLSQTWTTEPRTVSSPLDRWRITADSDNHLENTYWSIQFHDWSYQIDTSAKHCCHVSSRWLELTKARKHRCLDPLRFVPVRFGRLWSHYFLWLTWHR